MYYSNELLTFVSELTICSLAFFTFYSVIPDPIAIFNARFGLNTTNIIILDEVQCRGDETSLIECQHAGIGRHNCRSSAAAGVVCRGSYLVIIICRATLEVPHFCQI